MAKYISPPLTFAFEHVIYFKQWHVEIDNMSIPRPLEVPCLFPFTFFFFFYLLATACGILVPQPRIELSPLAMIVKSLNHWTSWEVPAIHS